MRCRQIFGPCTLEVGLCFRATGGVKACNPVSTKGISEQLKDALYSEVCGPHQLKQLGNQKMKPWQENTVMTDVSGNSDEANYAGGRTAKKWCKHLHPSPGSLDPRDEECSLSHTWSLLRLQQHYLKDPLSALPKYKLTILRKVPLQFIPKVSH